MAIRVVYGADEYSVATRVRALRQQAGSGGFDEANTSVFDGDRIDVGKVLAAAHATPFLAERRVVIVKGLLGRIEGPAGGRRGGGGGGAGGRVDVARLTEGLKDLPSTTELIFSDGPLKPNGAGLRAAGPQAQREEHERRKGADLANWIARRFVEQQARASPAAVARLAELVGDDTRALDQEVLKLATFAGKDPVQREHVELLVAPAREANLYAAVDAVLERRLAVATRLLYQLLSAGQSVQSIIMQIGTQVRRVLIAQELLSAGASPAADRDKMAARVGASPGFQLAKTIEQASRFPSEYLAESMRRLLQADLAIKSGEIEERLALELLTARLASGR
ncbi:MAG: DNA polymerase III subunit delta [Chloroflexi bacterium]|nr:DNA polymerase III subunit delta [Chloroflexota bacterium]